MGVADNKSYKNMYHFTDAGWGVDREDMPSINIDPNINHSIKENPYRSNVNIEKDEVVLEPDMSALFQAKGKKHYDGGMDVNLKPNSFIFSDDSKLAFDERDHKLFEFKEGGNFNKTINTPADVLKRNIDTKHYNTMVANIKDIKKDDFTKKSSALMLQKYLQTLGNIAFVQEQKKQFPDGLPEFAQNSAPVYNTELKDEIQTQKQFAKYGGSVNNPYGNPEAQFGGRSTTNTPGIGTGARTGSPISPCHIDDIPCQQHHARIAHRTNNHPAPRVNPAPDVKPFGYHPSEQTQGHVCPDGSPGFFNSVIGQWDCPSVQVTGNYAAPNKLPDPHPTDVTGPAQNGKPINWEFSPYQLESQMYNALKYATAKRYMPYRSHLNASYAEPNLINPEQTIGDLKSGANSQIDSLDSLSPILRNAQAGNIYGQFLDKIPGVRSQYDAQNSGTINQFRAQNNQIRNNETAQNMQNDQQYYQQTITGQANFDNMKNYLGDQFMNNRMRDVETNQSLAYNLATLGPKPAYGYNFRTGDFYRNEKNILDAEGNGKADMYQSLAGKILEKINKGEEVPKGWYESMKALSLGKLDFKKKGGNFNPYK